MKNWILLSVSLLALATWNIFTPAIAEEAHDHAEETHEEESHGHEDEHGRGEEGHHEENKTEIAPEAAKKAGVVTESIGPKNIGQIIPLTGRIIVDQNTKADVRARFAGIVRSVKANLGQRVEKGDVLAVVESNESLREYTITSPISGVVLSRSTNQGDVASDTPLFTIADLSQVWAKFHVFPKDADSIKAEQSVHVHTLDKSRKTTADIEMLFPLADELSQTLVAIAPLPNQDNQWRPGMTIEGDVVTSEKQVPVAVPVSALQNMEGQAVVFVSKDNTYEAVPVQTGITDGEYVEITSGLSGGESVVADGSFIIKADIQKSGAAHEH